VGLKASLCSSKVLESDNKLLDDLDLNSSDKYIYLS